MKWHSTTFDFCGYWFLKSYSFFSWTVLIKSQNINRMIKCIINFEFELTRATWYVPRVKPDLLTFNKEHLRSPLVLLDVCDAQSSHFMCVVGFFYVFHTFFHYSLFAMTLTVCFQFMSLITHLFYLLALFFFLKIDHKQIRIIDILYCVMSMTITIIFVLNMK